MPEPIDWHADGTPFSQRFNDRYRSELGGLMQACGVFLHGCGLPNAWAQKPQWCVLETGFGLGLNFLVTWQAWKADALRPRMLHFVSTEAFPASADDMLRGAASHPELMPLATQLHAQLWGLLPGVHRLVFEGGQVLLTLLVGDAKTMLRAQKASVWQADSVYLDGFSPHRNPDIWDVDTLKAVARCCRRGTRLATWTVARSVRDALTQCGFVVHKAPGTPPKRDSLQGTFDPHWKLDNAAARPALAPARCIVVGAGLAGAAVAASLARRGWQVTVLDAAPSPAAGASSLPAGVLAPHVSPDDSVLSQLSRSGVRATLQQAHALLTAGIHWQSAGVLERCMTAPPRRPPASWQTHGADAARDWLREADAGQLALCGLNAADGPALWHVHSGWVTPAALVRAWLAQPGIEFRGGAAAARLVRAGPVWQVLDEGGALLAAGERVVLAAGPASVVLAASLDADNDQHESPLEALALQPVRGQVLLGSYLFDESAAAHFPGFPVNGHGSFISGVPGTSVQFAGLEPPAGMHIWLAGATYERDSTRTQSDAADDAYNLDRLRKLLPGATADLPSDRQAWTGVRCATPNRLPALGPLVTHGTGNDEQAANIWVCSGMGSRGLTFAALCGELLAARWHGEPLAVAPRLARAMSPRFQPRPVHPVDPVDPVIGKD